MSDAAFIAWHVLLCGAGLAVVGWLLRDRSLSEPYDFRLTRHGHFRFVAGHRRELPVQRVPR